MDKYTKMDKEANNSIIPCPPLKQAPTETCCNLVCFDRPHYFCGHLLTDADLMREQWYFREKNKLYHRAQDGHGIVCGLRLTCEPNCSGSVRVGDGYAIDDCGNDLVVCNPQPFDVVALLRQKGYLVEQAPPDPCEKEKESPECLARQCFYVTICYQEEPSDFITPFIAGCRPVVSDCEPTRIHESVRFDVLKELPKESGWLDKLRDRLGRCFRLFSEGPFAQSLIKNKDFLTAVLAQAKGENIFPKKCHDLFCELRGLLLLHLKQYPDKYNCTIVDDILKIPFPSVGENSHEDCLDGCSDALCRLLEIAWQHAVSCWLGELIPPCPDPSQAGCIVLGTVEVLDGRVVSVCNCPRTYVWSFERFFEVLLATLLGNLACKETDYSDQDDDGCGKTDKHVCCRTFDIDCRKLFALLKLNPEAAKLAGTDSVYAIDTMRNALQSAFDLTRRDTFSARILKNMDETKLKEAVELLGVRAFRIDKEPLVPKTFHPSEVLQMLGLSTFDDPVAYREKDKHVVSAFTDRRTPGVLDIEEQKATEARVSKAMGKSVIRLQEQIEELKGELQELHKILQKTDDFGDEKPPTDSVGDSPSKQKSVPKRPKK